MEGCCVMSSNEVNENIDIEIVEKKDKKKKDFRGIILFVVFFAMGAAGAYFGTKYFVEQRQEETKKGDPVVEQIDITDKSEYQDTINELYEIIKGNSEYYSTDGLSVDTMSNNFKYGLLYDYILANNNYTDEKLPASYVGSPECSTYFLVDTADTTVCSVYKIEKSAFNKAYKELFNLSDLDTSVMFNPINSKYCVPVDNNYYCGNIYSINNITGSLDTRFSITKVIKDTNGYIYIYDKGYLIDNRSSLIKEEGKENYYLHASNSTNYYHELKSADNYTFKHTFKMNEDEEYYYVSSEVEEQ